MQREREMKKHFWTVSENDTLVGVLHELHENTMWRADCDFKNGYLAQQKL